MGENQMSDSLEQVPVEDPDLSVDQMAPHGRHIPQAPHSCGEPYAEDKEGNPYCPVHGDIRQLQR
jgi:hypothetical protein